MEIKLIELPNGNIAEKATYKEQMVSDYRSNPLIEALPPIFKTENEVAERLKNYPAFHPDERNLEANFRFHCIHRLKHYFQPDAQARSVERKFGITIRQGYLSRNPFDKRFIQSLYDGHKEIMGTVEDTYSDIGHIAMGFACIGVSGMGKSTAINRVLHQYPQVIVHSEYNGNPTPISTQVTYLKLDCPDNGESVKDLCMNFFYRMDELLGTNYKKFANPAHTVGKMKPQMKQVARNHALGVLIIDEIQNLREAKQGGGRRFINFLVSLVNEVGVPIIVIGTPSALAPLQEKFRGGRRAEGDHGVVSWDLMKKDAKWDNFVNGLFKYNWTQEALSEEEEKELSDMLFYESQGNTDIAVKLFRMAQMKAISSKKEKVTTKTIAQIASKEFALIKPALSALKSGRAIDLAAFDDIRKVDIEAFIEEHRAKIELDEVARLHKRAEQRQEKEARDKDLQDLVVKLLDLKVAKPNECQRVALAVMEDYKGNAFDFDEAVKESLRLIFAGTSLKEEKKIKKESRKVSKIEEDPMDLRRMLRDANSSARPFVEVLKQAGYLCDVVNEFSVV